MTTNGTNGTTTDPEPSMVHRLARMRRVDLLALAFQDAGVSATGTRDQLLGAMTHDQLVSYLVDAGRRL